jgi:peptidoglycan/xylan/chitin deacetylase (PgdA/CDA1 family)
MAGAVSLQPQFANAVSAALTQVQTDVAPKTLSSTETTDSATLDNGTYRVPDMSTANKVLNLPVTWPGTLHTFGKGTSVRSQFFLPSYVGSAASNGSEHALLYARRTNQGGGWNPWIPVGGRHDETRQGALRLAGMRQRVGAVKVTTPATVTIVMDHGLTNVESKVLPLLRARNLRATLAINSQKWDDPDNSGATQADVKTWTDTFEIANHGRNHLLTGDLAADREEIEGGRDELESQLGVTVDTWVQTGNGSSSYDFADGNALANYWTTTTGQFIARSHAVWTGLVPHTTKRYPIDGQPKPGAHGFWIDTGTATAQTQVETAINEGTGVIIRLHPQFLDTTGYLTTTELTAFLDFLVARRDAGEVTVLPFREWSVADKAANIRRGTGSPEGVVVAPVGTVYTDTAATAGAVEWVKASGTGNTGWQVAHGDTGWRTLTVEAGVTGTVHVRRVGSLVLHHFSAVTPGSSGHTNIVATPTGFRPPSLSGANWRNGVVISDSGSARVVSYHNGYQRILNAVGGTAYGGTFAYATNEAWPSTLPGTPS